MKKPPTPPAAATELRHRAEARFKTRKAEPAVPLTEADSARLFHELQVHQIELELQNEELHQARAEAEALAEQYSSIYEFSPVAYLILDEVGTIRKANLTAARQLGVERSRLLQQRFGAFVTKESSRTYGDFLHRVLAGDTAQYCEVEMMPITGQPIFVRMEGVRAPNEAQGRVVLVDITERRQAEERLLASEVRYRRLFESAKDGILILDAETGMVLDVNPFLMELLGYSHENFLGKKVWELGFLKEVVANQASFAALRETEQIRYEAMTLETSAGRRIDMELILTAFEVQQKKMIQCNLRDISERLQAKAALQESEVKFHALFSGMNEGVAFHEMIYGPEGQAVDYRIVEVNPAFERHTGITAAAARGRRASEVYGPGPVPFLEIYAQVARTGQPRSFEADFPPPHRSFAISVYAPKPGWFGTVFSEITERRRAAEALQLSQELYRSLVECLPMSIFRVDREGNFLFCNQRFADSIGRTVPQVLGHKDADLFQPLQAKFYRQGDQKVMATGLIQDQVEEHLRPDGQMSYVQVMKVPLRDVAGGVVGIQGIFWDITERRRTEESHARLATAVAAAAETIVITDAEANILYANPAFALTSGYSCAEALGQNLRVLKSGKQDANFYREMWAVLKAGRVWQGRMINRRKDGTLFEEEASISPALDGAGRIVNYVAVKRDITREVQLEEQFRQIQKLEAVGLLAGGVAHDFNNLLAVVLMNASVLDDEKSLTPEQADFIKDIIESAQRGATLTRQLLTFSRQQALHAQALDLNEVVLGVTKMLRQIIGEDVKLTTSLAPGTAPIWGDPGMMEQVLMNLAVNARDALPNGGKITIELAGLAVDESIAAGHKVQAGDFFRMTVRDNGTGIAPEHLPHIFEPFYTTKDVGQGTGLGLATVHGIVQQHQGWIEVESQLGEGTAFHIHLPRLATAAPAKTEEQAQVRPHGGRETVLLVEDAEDLRKLAALCLAKYGYRVLEAATGAAALEVWRQHRSEVALLLTDIIMPDGVSGRQLAAQLQAAHPKLKVLYMSGYPGEVASRGGLELREGFNFLQKPFAVVKLAQTVRACLDRV